MTLDSTIAIDKLWEMEKEGGEKRSAAPYSIAPRSEGGERAREERFAYAL